MKYLFGVLVFFCFFHAADSSATPIFVYNHGYVLGELTGVDLIGPNQRIVSGVVSVGNNGFGGQDESRDELGGDYVLQNPWTFCGGLEFYEKLAAHIGEYAVIEYKTPKKSSLLQCQSPNEIVGIYPVSREGPGSVASESSRIKMAGKPYGVTVGRIVNAQKSDRHGDNWSVVIQVGNGGNDFRYMQIIDADLYAFALDCLVSATRVNVYHVERIGGVARYGRVDTYVWRIEAKPGL